MNIIGKDLGINFGLLMISNDGKVIRNAQKRIVMTEVTAQLFAKYFCTISLSFFKIFFGLEKDYIFFPLSHPVSVDKHVII